MSRDAPASLDWARLAQYVVADRVRQGYRSRGSFAAANRGVNVRVLSDIETARRANYDPVTIATLEQALDWATGSVHAVLRGGEPTNAAEQPAGDRAALRQIRLILGSELAAGLTAETKLAMIRDVINRDAPEELDEPAQGEPARRVAGG